MSDMPPPLGIRSTRYLGTFPPHRASAWVMIGQDGGQSIPLGEQTLFVFSDTLLAALSARHPDRPVPRAFGSKLGPQGMFLANSAALSSERNLRQALATMRYYTDEDGFVQEILQPLDRERLQGIRLWPEHGIQLGECVYLYYLGIQTTDSSSHWGFRTLGTGLAVFDPTTGSCERLWRGGDWRFWPSVGDDFHFGVQILQEKDWLYVYGSIRSGLYCRARVARVRPQDITDPQRYEFLGSSTVPHWNSSLAASCDLGLCGSDYSVSFNSHLGQYLMFYVDGYGKQLMARTAHYPWGPYSNPTPVVGLPHEAGQAELIYLGFEHPRFSLDGGSTVFVSYCQPHFTRNSLLTVRFR